MSSAPPGITRRQVLRCAATAVCLNPRRAGGQGAGSCDLLVRRGHVIDPASSTSALLDVAVRAGRVARVAATIPPSEARDVLDATGCLMTPGLVDMHVHLYDGVAPISISPKTSVF